jgi:hypothetical protein
MSTGSSENAAEVSYLLHSIVGLIPLFAVTTMEPGLLAELPGFKSRVEWFLANRPDLAQLVSRWQEEGSGERRLLAILRGHRMKGVLRRMLDETEYLSPYGVRALSRHHAEQPFVYEANGARYTVGYEPAESTSGLFGGNSNWPALVSRQLPHHRVIAGVPLLLRGRLHGGVSDGIRSISDPQAGCR